MLHPTPEIKQYLLKEDRVNINSREFDNYWKRMHDELWLKEKLLEGNELLLMRWKCSKDSSHGAILWNSLQCSNATSLCSEKGHYAKSCPKPRVVQESCLCVLSEQCSMFKVYDWSVILPLMLIPLSLLVSISDMAASSDHSNVSRMWHASCPRCCDKVGRWTKEDEVGVDECGKCAQVSLGVSLLSGGQVRASGGYFRIWDEDRTRDVGLEEGGGRSGRWGGLAVAYEGGGVVSIDGEGREEACYGPLGEMAARWYNELADGKLKDETLALKAKIEGSNYEASNIGDTQENQGHEEHKESEYLQPFVPQCNYHSMKDNVHQVAIQMPKGWPYGSRDLLRHDGMGRGQHQIDDMEKDGKRNTIRRYQTRVWITDVLIPDLAETMETVNKETTMAKPNDYITATRKNFVSNDNEGRMVKKCIVEIQGTFLVKIRYYAFNGNIRENAFKHIDKFLVVFGAIKINGLTQDRFRLSVFPVSLAGAAIRSKIPPSFDHDEEEETEEDDNPNETDNVLKIFKIKGNMFDFETPLCEAFYESNYLLKINTDLFTYDIQNFKTYDEYERELNNDIAKGTEEP
ncbi:hypothetical protein Tco_0609195 [Tanacetum coccineum]